MYFTLIDHPLVQHKLTMLRDVNTGSKEFRELVSETSMLMCYEAMRDLPTKNVEVHTPLGVASSKVISGSADTSCRSRHGGRCNEPDPCH